MSCFNPRLGVLPNNLIIMSIESGTLPAHFAHECAYYNKFLKQVPNNCTNPGNSVGGATHDHGCGGGHDHPCISGASAHTHPISTSSYPVPGSWSPSPGPPGPTLNTSHSPHSHGGSTSPVTAPVTIPGSDGAHAHPTGNNDIRTYTVRYLKNSTQSISMRQKVLASGTTLMWNKTLATIPDDYGLQACLVNEYVKGVPDACTAPLNLNNPCNHSHGAVCHTHAITVNPHTHTITINPVGGSSPNIGAGASSHTPPHTHPHPGSGTGGGASPNTSGPHAHCGSTLELSRTETAFITKNKVDIRKPDVPIGITAIFGGNLACIPNGYQLNNGCNGTINMLDRYPKGVPTSCTNPGTNTGSNTHTHEASVSHGSICVPHVHPAPNTGTSNATPSGVAPSPQPQNTPVTFPHTHTTTVNSATNPISLPASPHTHGAIDHKPDTVEVAFIERI